MTSGTNKKHPPISLDELEEEGEEEVEVRGKQAPRKAEPGELTYTKAKRGSSGIATSGGWKAIAVPVALAVVISGVMIFGTTAPKKDVATLDSNVKVVQANVDAAKTELQKSISEIDVRVSTAITEARSAKSAVEGVVRPQDLASYATTSYVDDRVNNVASQLATKDYTNNQISIATNPLAAKAYVDSQIQAAMALVTANLTAKIPTASPVNEWQVYVKSSLSGSSLQLDVLAGAPTQAVVYVELEPVNGSGFWSPSSTLQVAGNVTETQALDFFNAHPPVTLQAGLDNLIPMYTLYKGSNDIWYLRTIAFVTPWFKADVVKLTKILTYSRVVGVGDPVLSFKIVTSAASVTTVGASAGW